VADSLSDDVDELFEVLVAVWGLEVEGSGHEGAAREAAANLMSGAGLSSSPTELLEIVRCALEVGYTVAVKREAGNS
jgi:hypothetical protein